MAAATDVAGRRVAHAPRPGRATTSCEGAATGIVDGRGDRAGRPHGAVLDLSGPDLRVLVVDGERRPILSLGPFPEEDVIATWRAIGGSAGLVPMIKSHDETQALTRSLGPLRICGVAARRRRASFGRARPRFLARRKAARLSACPQVHCGVEMAAGGDRR